jgi:hypothetical protein
MEGQQLRMRYRVTHASVRGPGVSGTWRGRTPVPPALVCDSTRYVVTCRWNGTYSTLTVYVLWAVLDTCDATSYLS